MGFLDIFKPQSSTPQIQTALPEMVIQEYKRGNLPTLNASKIFLKKGEACHYFDKAIYEKKEGSPPSFCFEYAESKSE